MPYGEDNNQDQYSRQPVAYGRGEIAAQRFQAFQEDLPMKRALDAARLQKDQAALEFQGRAQLDKEHNETQLLREGAAFYAGKATLQKYLNDNGFTKGSPEYAAAYGSYASQFPAALAHLPNVAATVKDESAVHDLKAQLNQGVEALNSLTLKPGQTARVDASGQPSVSSGAPVNEAVAQRYARVQGDLSGYKAKQAGEIARQATANKGTPNVPYDVTNEKAAPIESGISASENEIKFLESQFPALKSAAPSTVAPPPAATPKPKTVNQGGVTYNLQEDGTYQ